MVFRLVFFLPFTRFLYGRFCLISALETAVALRSATQRNAMAFAAYASSSIHRHDPSIIPDGRPRPPSPARARSSFRPSVRIVMNQFRQPKTQLHGVHEKVYHFILISHECGRIRRVVNLPTLPTLHEQPAQLYRQRQ